ncbi:MAG: adenylate kinase family protein [Candidatus Bathyarchaeota archaeon]|nr:adenylate kinase family protein [Candidatus Bathyarchaeota archaeon]
MIKRVILITGTPCVGKTTVSKALASALDAVYVNLTELALKENLVLGVDEERDSTIIDETAMKKKIEEIVEQCDRENVVIDGHYASLVVGRDVGYVFVLRRNPIELKEMMEDAGFAGRKMWENLASEILDVCLIDALENHAAEKVCEIDVSHKRTAEVVSEIIAVLNGHQKCRAGVVDWLRMLENQGVLDEVLKI